MEWIESVMGSAVMRLSRDEMVLLNNALNEVCNGVDIGDDEFQTRLGSSREHARVLLSAFSDALERR